MGEVEVPDEIELGDQVFDLCFHPTVDVVACGLVNGVVELYRYGVGDGANTKVLKTKHAAGSSCRGVQFSADGMQMYTIGSDRRLQIVDSTGKIVREYDDAHNESINRMLLLSENLLATGDDSGEVKVWDLRASESSGGAAMAWHIHEDFISALTFSPEQSTLLSCSGDATLGVYDIRRAANTSRSDDQEAELQCISVIKGGRKVLAGTQEGVLLVFSWGRWGDCSDRYPGHPESVDCMMKVDEKTVLTGSGDGMIRCVQIQPNKILGVIGDHEDFPVEGMRADRGGRVLGTHSHDNIVRFWDISMFADDNDDNEGLADVSCEDGTDGGAAARMDAGEEDEEDDDGEEEEEEEEEDENDEENEDAEMEEDGNSTPFDSGSDDDDDDDDDDQDGSGQPQFKTAAEKFYADL